MAKKSYKPQDNELPQVNESVAAYHVTTPNANLYVPTEYEQEIIMHSEKDYEEGRLHTQEDVDKLVERKPPVIHVFSATPSISIFVPKNEIYDDTRRSCRNYYVLQGTQSNL